jgi:hypothetical protein
MAGLFHWIGEHKLSWVLAAGVIAAIWYVLNHKDKLMLDKSAPPEE